MEIDNYDQQKAPAMCARMHLVRYSLEAAVQALAMRWRQSPRASKARTKAKEIETGTERLLFQMFLLRAYNKTSPNYGRVSTTLITPRGSRHGCCPCS
jgi:hypothetical protein